MENDIENNKIIAEFMGAKLTKDLKIMYPVYEGDSSYVKNLKYHSDWNWLMSVVEKIHSMQSYGVFINPNGTYIQDEDDKVICMTFKNEEVNGEIISSSNIEATFNCCAEFVKWYNEQNKK